MKTGRKVLVPQTIFVACAIALSVTSAAQANQPGRGSEKDRRSAEGAALTNAQYDKNAGVGPGITAGQGRRVEPAGQQPGRGKPSDIRSAEGAAVQNKEKAAGQAGTDAAKGDAAARGTRVR